MIRFCALLLILLPGLAAAGAWPRERGAVFLSLGQEFLRDGEDGNDGSQSVLLEYGMTKKLTLGAKLWRRTDGSLLDAYAFARYPIGQTGGTHRFAAGFGLGMRRYVGGEMVPMVRPELSWGMGFDTSFAPGWVGADVSATQLLGTEDDIWVNADLTFGLSPTDNSHVIVQLRGYHQTSGYTLTIAPSYVVRIREGMKVEIGATHRLAGSEHTGLLLGTWLEF